MDLVPERQMIPPLLNIQQSSHSSSLWQLVLMTARHKYLFIVHLLPEDLFNAESSTLPGHNINTQQVFAERTK